MIPFYHIENHFIPSTKLPIDGLVILHAINYIINSKENKMVLSKLAITIWKMHWK